MHLLTRIERCRQRSGMPPTRFGREAIKDPNLIKDMRRGRRLRPATEQRILHFLAAQEAVR